MERYECEMVLDDEQSVAVAITMVSAVVTMALTMVATVLMFHSGGSIIA